ncbi:histidine phosphotransfer protein HptB [Candidatus Magnetomoraceae bacterium gMMP-1]
MKNLNKNTRILVVENNKVNQHIIIIILKKLGYHVDAVNDGEKALKALEKESYDVVLMDILMPNMNGIETTKIIRSKKSNILNHDIPIIALTANTTKNDIKTYMEIGMNGHIPKPFNEKILIETIEKCLDNYRINKTKNIEPESKSNDKTKSMEDRSYNETEVIDRNAMIKELGDNEDIANKLMEIFMKTLPYRLQKIKNAIEEDNIEVLAVEIHTLKGTSGTFKANAMMRIISEIEQAGKNHDMKMAYTLFKKLENEVIKLQTITKIFI